MQEDAPSNETDLFDSYLYRCRDRLLLICIKAEFGFDRGDWAIPHWTYLNCNDSIDTFETAEMMPLQNEAVLLRIPVVFLENGLQIITISILSCCSAYWMQIKLEELAGRNIVFKCLLDSLKYGLGLVVALSILLGFLTGFVAEWHSSGPFLFAFQFRNYFVCVSVMMLNIIGFALMVCPLLFWIFLPEQFDISKPEQVIEMKNVKTAKRIMTLLYVIVMSVAIFLLYKT